MQSIKVCKNLEKIKDKPGFRIAFGKIIDDILESIENYDDAFLGTPNDGTGYKVDDCIRKHLPDLLDAGLVPFPKGNEGCPIDIDLRERWGKYNIAITREQLMVHVGKITSVLWERLAYVKGGGVMGENMGKLTKFTHEQLIKATKIASSVLGSDAGVLTPHIYSKLFCTEMQNGLIWDAKKLAWDTAEFPINTKENVRYNCN